MPTYVYKCDVCEEIWEESHPYEERDSPIISGCTINTCNGTVFVGKQMNYELGKFIKNNGFRGAFPWAANYDSVEYNNSLVVWLFAGMK